jgi:hypothetical protein
MVPKIDEDHARFWDLLLKGFGIVAAIIIQIHFLPPTSTPANPIAEMVERWFALYKAQANLALACRQDSGSEFHLNDQQVQKYKTNAEDSAQIWATILKQK